MKLALLSIGILTIIGILSGIVQAQERFGFGDIERTEKDFGFDRNGNNNTIYINGSGNFSGLYVDLDFTGTTGLDDNVDNDTTYENVSEFLNDAQYINMTQYYENATAEFYSINNPNGYLNQTQTDTLYHSLNNGTFTGNVTAQGGYLCYSGGCYYIPDLALIQNPFDQSLNTTDNVQFQNINANFINQYNGATGFKTSQIAFLGGALPVPYLEGQGPLGHLAMQPGLYLYDNATNTSYLYFPDDSLFNNWAFIHDRTSIPANLILDYTGTGGNFTVQEWSKFTAGIETTVIYGPTGSLIQIDGSNSASYLIINSTDLQHHYHNETNGQGDIIPHERNSTHPCNYDTNFVNYHERPIIIRTTAQLDVASLGDVAYITAYANGTDLGDTGWTNMPMGADAGEGQQYDHLTFEVQPGETYSINTTVGGSGAVGCKHIIKELF